MYLKDNLDFLNSVCKHTQIAVFVFDNDAHTEIPFCGKVFLTNSVIVKINSPHIGIGGITKMVEETVIQYFHCNENLKMVNIMLAVINEQNVVFGHTKHFNLIEFGSSFEQWWSVLANDIVKSATNEFLKKLPDMLKKEPCKEELKQPKKL